MLNGKYISSKELINEVYRDNKYSYELPFQDAIEWCVNAIELIGAPAALQPKQEVITITDFRGILPCDLYNLTQAAGSFGGCIPFPMTLATNTFHPVFTCTHQINKNLIDQTGLSDIIQKPIGQDISGNPVYEINDDNYIFPISTTNTSRGSLNDAKYNLNGNFIFTNYESGYVFLAYTGLPVDKEGFPLIPDNRRYKEAVKSYVRYKIDYILYRTNMINRAIFEHSEREWMFYVASAANISKIPNVDGMEAMLRMMKLIPQKYAHNNFFNSLGS